MKRILLLGIFVLVFSAVLVNAQNPADERAAKWRQDLLYLANTLPARHPNPFLQAGKPVFTQAVAALDAQIPKLPDPEIIVGMAKIVALLGDAHTTLNLWQPGLNFHFFPLALTWLNDGYYVTGAATPYASLLGARLLQIGGKDVSAVERELAAIISHENESWLKAMAPYSLNSAEVLQALHVLTPDHPGLFQFQLGKEAPYTQELQAVSPRDNLEWQTLPGLQPAPTRLYLKNPGRFYWYEYLPESKSLYFQYNSCRNMPQPSFAKFSKDLLTFLDKHPISRVLIDLRFNSGGNPGLLEPFIAELKKRSAINQKGRLFVLIGRNTFDAAVVNAVQLRNDTNAILIGEPTGGKPVYFGEVRSFKLPNSGIEITYATKYYNQAKDNSPALVPQIPVAVTADLFLNGNDPILEKAIQGY